MQEGARERGWRIHLIEPFEPGHEYQPSYDARSTALSYGTRLIYQRLGLWDRIAERAEPILRIHVSERGRFGAARLDARNEAVEALGYVVENAWIGHCLWQALDDGWWCAIARPKSSGLGDRLSFTPMCTAAAPACEQLGIRLRAGLTDRTALIANITPGKPHGGLAFERFTEDGPMALLPLQDHRLRPGMDPLAGRCRFAWPRPTNRCF